MRCLYWSLLPSMDLEYYKPAQWPMKPAKRIPPTAGSLFAPKGVKRKPFWRMVVYETSIVVIII